MRRWLVLALAFVLAPALASAQTISFVNSLGGGGSAVFSDGNEAFALGYTPAAGTLTIGCIGGATATVSSFSGLGGTWALAVSVNTGGPGQVACYYTRDGTGSGSTVTVTMSGNDASANVRHAFWTFSQSGGAGFDAANEHVNSAGANGGSSPYSSGNATATDANNVCVGMMKGSSGNYTAITGGWTSTTIADTARGRAGYIIQSSATAQAFTVTGDTPEDYNVAITCVDSPAGGGGGSTAPGMMLMGVGADAGRVLLNFRSDIDKDGVVNRYGWRFIQAEVEETATGPDAMRMWVNNAGEPVLDIPVEGPRRPKPAWWHNTPVELDTRVPLEAPRRPRYRGRR